ncbi:hypothetical protein YQE_12402, partial [Dendroctonus ponderosae]
MRQLVWCVVIFQIFVSVSLGANILAIIPTASFAHQMPFRPLWRELAKRGHNITLVTTDPMDDLSLKGVKEIDIGYGYQIMEKHQVFDTISNDSKSFIEMGRAFVRAFNETNNKFFQSPEGQNLIHNKDNHYDLLMVEAQLPAMMVFSWWYQIPFIGLSSMDCALQYHDTAGNLVHHLVTPDPNMQVQDTFWDRLKSFLYIWIYRALLNFTTFPKEQRILQQYFGANVPTIPEIQNNMSMLFVATNPIFQPIRALMPNTITVGNGMHIGESKPLAPEIQRFLDEAEEGAIYFSLGTNVKSRYLNASAKSELLKAFTGLPYRVLWKTDEQFDDLPANIKAQKWFSSQPDILLHPNIKLFITQGGLQSMQESLNANKPMIGISFFGDQHSNVDRMVQLGFGLKVHKHNITEETVREAIGEVISNFKYSDKAKEFGDIFRDAIAPNVETAAWWTEYVLRHKGAKHFRNPLLDMPLWKAYMLDVFGLICLFIFVFIRLLSLILHSISRNIC